MRTIRTYSELSKLKTFDERFRYLMLRGTVGSETFGYDRYLNQALYHSDDWDRVRDLVIIRDNGCDLGIEGNEIHSRIIVHHMNPITVDDIYSRSELVLDPEFLICTSLNTHNGIHYGDEALLKERTPVIRTPNDQCPWRIKST